MDATGRQADLLHVPYAVDEKRVNAVFPDGCHPSLSGHLVGHDVKYHPQRRWGLTVVPRSATRAGITLSRSPAPGTCPCIRLRFCRHVMRQKFLCNGFSTVAAGSRRRNNCNRGVNRSCRCCSLPCNVSDPFGLSSCNSLSVTGAGNAVSRSFSTGCAKLSIPVCQFPLRVVDKSYILIKCW